MFQERKPQNLQEEPKPLKISHRFTYHPSKPKVRRFEKQSLQADQPTTFGSRAVHTGDSLREKPLGSTGNTTASRRQLTGASDNATISQ